MAEAKLVKPDDGICLNFSSAEIGRSNWASNDEIVVETVSLVAADVVVVLAVVDAELPLKSCLSRAFCCCCCSAELLLFEAVDVLVDGCSIEDVVVKAGTEAIGAFCKADVDITDCPTVADDKAL